LMQVNAAMRDGFHGEFGRASKKNWGEMPF